jgi:hypothetical protein
VARGEERRRGGRRRYGERRGGRQRRVEWRARERFFREGRRGGVKALCGGGEGRTHARAEKVGITFCLHFILFSFIIIKSIVQHFVKISIAFKIFLAYFNILIIWIQHFVKEKSQHSELLFFLFWSSSI